MEAKSHLEKLGHTLTPFEMPDHSRLWFSMMTDDTMAKSFLKNTKNDAISECVSELRKTLLFLPLYRRVFRTIVYVCRKLDIKSEFGQEIAEFPELEKEAFTKELLEKMENLDLLLCPVFPFCAISAHAMAPVSMKLQCMQIEHSILIAIYLIHFLKMEIFEFTQMQCYTRTYGI